MNNDLENKILEKIEKEEIKPIPKTYFVIKNILFWSFWFFSIIIGALAFSVIEHMVVNNDWDLYKYSSDSFLVFVLSTLPYLWIFLMLIFIGIAYLNFANVKGGYKHRIQYVLVSSIIISILLGTGFSYAQVGEKIDKILSEKIPQYRMAKQENELKIWNKPQRGILSGEIKSINENGFILECCCNMFWNVSGFDVKSFYENGIKNIRVLGERTGEREFRAYDVRPASKYKEIKEKVKEMQKNKNNKNIKKEKSN
ncbi:MAG TPA: hypothetical protein PLA41_00040 [Candidatus Pacearchaeota archaeon]|nr:hypothetical protein [Candidatus Parcubacteria bacterium]HNZ83860.1 hypothetical protein [Candidatus Pacearchaeota archaeon]HOU45532.1 hypothetical protein [Candidatus Pacearchaeota archaeon]HPM08577.1 hypothetical protein [Candidatus Pacearchaeota archaeon]HQI74310.1 hypothetical protein [Candidatus Pacearchaeota archaeon]